MKLISIAGVLALAAALFFFFSSSSSSTDKDEAKATSDSAVEPATGAQYVKPVRAGQGRPASPKRLGAAPNTEPMSDEQWAKRSYELEDGTKVFDHRAKPSEPNAERYVVLPSALSKVQPDTVVAVRRALRPAMNECIATHGQGAVEGGKATATLLVSIEDELLRVDTVKVQIAGLDEAEEEALRACVSEGILGHEQVVEGSEDVKSHRMNFPYSL